MIEIVNELLRYSKSNQFEIIVLMFDDIVKISQLMTKQLTQLKFLKLYQFVLF